MKITIDNEVYTLDIEKAKKYGALIKKDNRVKSWEEYLIKHKNSPAYSYNDFKGEIEVFTTNNPTSMEQQLTSKDTEVIWAISCLMKLRRDWVGNWDHINLNGLIMLLYILKEKYVYMNILL